MAIVTRESTDTLTGGEGVYILGSSGVGRSYQGIHGYSDRGVGGWRRGGICILGSSQDNCSYPGGTYVCTHPGIIPGWP